MIEGIKIKNFKSIKDKDFNLRNLNVLLGLNGMGKSSFVQSLLCLRQSNSLSQGILSLNNSSYINLGTTRDVLYQYSKKGEFLEFSILFNDEKKLNLEFDYIPEADYFPLKSPTDRDRNLEINSIRNDKSLFNNNFQYLNANRLEPRSANPKNFTKVVSDRSLGNHGEYTAHFIEVYNGEEIAFDNLVHKDSSTIDELTGNLIFNKTLINQINLWMGAISPGVNIRTTTISSDFVLLEYVFKQPNFGNTNRFKPENVGFGISYGLPVVVALLSAKPGDLIIIENPESHIHPRGQAELGKLIARTAMNDVQIIVETHSDHVINGIRVAIKESELLNDKVILFYFNKIVEAREQYSKILDIEIDKNGELSSYPENLLDEWSNQLLKLL